MTLNEVEKYRLPVRIMHWVHTGAFIVLFLTGMMLYLPRETFGFLERWTHLGHLAAAVVFVGVPVIYFVFSPRSAARGLKIAFTWGSNDFKWLIASPRLYLFGNDKNLPPQGLLNSGQKVWWLLTILSWLTFSVTGATMWFFVKSASPPVLERMVMAHDISFIVAGAMFLGHIYLALFNPKMNQALGAMTRGKVTAEYAEKYHGKWYAEISAKKKP
jgi:formate dehydrogenase subunit gamma